MLKKRHLALPQLKSCPFEEIVPNDQCCQLREKTRFATSILKTIVMATPHPTTKRVTLSRQHEFLSSWKQNFSTLQRQTVFIKLATLVFEYNFLNLTSFSRRVTSGSDSYHFHHSYHLPPAYGAMSLLLLILRDETK